MCSDCLWASSRPICLLVTWGPKAQNSVWAEKKKPQWEMWSPCEASRLPPCLFVWRLIAKSISRLLTTHDETCLFEFVLVELLTLTFSDGAPRKQKSIDPLLLTYLSSMIPRELTPWLAKADHLDCHNLLKAWFNMPILSFHTSLLHHEQSIWSCFKVNGISQIPLAHFFNENNTYLYQ